MVYKTELYHHGIKGMKWGVRRYQNYDGSLKPAGEKRYSSDGGDSSKKKKIDLDKAFEQNIKVGKDKSPISSAEKITKELQKAIDNATQLSNTMSKVRKKNKKSNSIDDLTNEELKAMIDRMQLEDRYMELSTKRIEAGRTKVSDILSMTGNVVGIASAVVGIVATVNKLRS